MADADLFLKSESRCEIRILFCDQTVSSAKVNVVADEFILEV